MGGVNQHERHRRQRGRMIEKGRFVWISLAALAVAGCGSEIPVLSIDGTWSFVEVFEDPFHQTGCDGQGTITLTETLGSSGVTDPIITTRFAGAGAIDNECFSLDGPFNYFGDAIISQGEVTIGPDRTVRWDALVNSAVCEYRGTASGVGTYANEMHGTLDCVLDDAVTFNFVGTWIARNWRSAWCGSRRSTPGCSR